MIAYFETSALLKLLVEEAGADEAATLWESADVVAVGRLAYPEARAALAAALRAGRMSAGDHRAAVSQLQRLWRQIHVVELNQVIAEAASDLAERHGLCGYDAVHLASALALGRRDSLLATWDADLAIAAREAGLAVFPA